MNGPGCSSGTLPVRPEPVEGEREPTTRSFNGDLALPEQLETHFVHESHLSTPTAPRIPGQPQDQNLVGELPQARAPFSGGENGRNTYCAAHVVR